VQISNLILQVSDVERSPHFDQDILEFPLLYAPGAFRFLDGGGV